MTHDSLKESSLAGRAFCMLRESILRGELLPGERLRIDALKQAHGFSSSPLREAMSRLVAENLVAFDSNRGFSVSAISVEELTELTEMRILMETEALRRSILAGADAWEANIVAAYHRLFKAEERHGDRPHLTLNDDWAIPHREFHLALLAAAGSGRLLRDCERLFDEGHRYRRLSARLRSAPRNKNLEHKLLLEATLDRNVDAAVSLLSDHIRRTADTMTKLLRTEPLAFAKGSTSDCTPQPNAKRADQRQTAA